VTHFRKGQHGFGERDDGLEPADLSAFFTQRAPGHIDLRHGSIHRNGFLDLRPDKQVGVGLFNVAVQKGDVTFNGKRHVGGHGGFTGAAFAAGNADNQSVSPLSGI